MNGYAAPTTVQQLPGGERNRPADKLYNDAQRYNGGNWLAHSHLAPNSPHHARSWSDDKRRPGWLSGLRESMGRYLPAAEVLPLSTARRRGALTQATPASLALPSTTTVRFVLLCGLWYMSSAMSSNTGKAILNQFRYPVTLTLVQFGFVAGYCLLFMSPAVRFTRLRRPTREILTATLPMGMFQVGGHMFSSMAISRIPVSTTHTIKALSPLFTVAAYALLFGVSYSAQTYISLVPLTVGVILACSSDMSLSNFVGLLCAFGSALVFVSSNIFFKKIMPSGSSQTSHKLDKLNLLLYSSGMAFLLMIPIWLWTDLPALMAQSREHGAQVYAGHPSKGHTAPHSVAYSFFMNGTVHFGQNIIAFIILSSTSPVTYSIASLIKRVVVICIAIVWFNQTIHAIQGLGIVLTFLGLWMYNSAKGSVEKGENKMRRVEAARDLQLPTSIQDEKSGELEGVTGAQPVAYGRDRARTVVVPPPHYEHQDTDTPPSARITGFAPSSQLSHHDQVHLPHVHRPPLRIDPSRMTQAQASKYIAGLVIPSPTDSYPSPPPSVDSPPESPPLGSGFTYGRRFSQQAVVA
ncbi:TPT-domain-containing protein [Neolentinus lepideus HHB14362 ss-1]|uniref:TPT-domain-containing protein n=1 Tax=Neolentinus lepideus HHB14362 ss-1 TaxID=1314782 RepID=A0A165SJL9_9AGAM|nr:TPT-domain-containing protein [Neolentinus lepideus HHB14362 ss-1]